MARPRMIVVAGPPGSGKTRYLPVSAFGIDWFNIDDRCAQILGSYRAIPRDVRRAVAAECERFVLDHIRRTESFAVETTLRELEPIPRLEKHRTRHEHLPLMQAVKGIVKNASLVVNEPTDLPEGEVVELVPLEEFLAVGGDNLDDQERAALHRELDASIAETEADKLLDADEVLAELRAMR
jgi:hypothetical protein